MDQPNLVDGQRGQAANSTVLLIVSGGTGGDCLSIQEDFFNGSGPDSGGRTSELEDTAGIKTSLSVGLASVVLSWFAFVE